MINSALFIALAALLVLPNAWAEESGGEVSPGKYRERMKKVPFGLGVGELVKHVEQHLRADYGERIATTTDIHQKDRLKAEIEVRVQAVRDSLVEFKGQKTGYNVSVVATEFAHSTGESMLVVPIARSHDYFFFVQGGLYKVVTTESRTTSFPVFLVNLTQLYGAPAKIEYRNPNKKDEPISAQWSDDKLSLEVADRPDFGTITLRWTKRDIEDRLVELRGGAKPPADTAGEGLDPTILDIMKD